MSTARSGIARHNVSSFWFLAATSLLLNSCTPPPPPAALVSVDVQSVISRCDGTFEANTKLDNKSGGKLTVDISVAAPVNVNPGAAPDSARATMDKGEFQQVTVTGTLTNPCLAGSLNLIVADGSTVTTPINIKASPIQLTAQSRAIVNSDSTFGYTLTFTCCAGGAAGAYSISFPARASTNVTDLVIESPNPAKANCPGPPTIVKVKGKLVDTSDPGIVIVEIKGPTGDLCTVKTKVQAG